MSFHRHSFRVAATLALAAALALTAGRSTAAAPAGSGFTYQGQLTLDGEAVDGTCDLQAALFESQVAGAQIGMTQTVSAVPVAAGLFTLTLDFGLEAFPGEARWLAIAVRCPAGAGAYTALEPRQPLAPMPYALHAVTADEAGTVAWTGLTGVPAAFADGADADTTYTAGAGLALSGTEFGVDPTRVQLRLSAGCGPGSAIRQVNEDGSVVCEVDDDLAYTAGPGLVLSGTQFSLLFSGPGLAPTAARGDHDHDERYATILGTDALLAGKADVGHSHAAEAIVSGTLDDARLPASLARVADLPASVAAAGFITQTLADNRYTYQAGAGLVLADQEFRLDLSAAQARVSAACAAGSAIRVVNADGSVVCEVDDNAVYSAGAGLTLVGGQFGVDLATVQARVTGACAPGTYVRTINQDGTVVCDTDLNSGGDILGVSAGAGLTGGGSSGAVTLSADTAYLQRRVAGTCTAGQKITAIAADGTVTCSADLDTNDTYSANWAGLTGIPAGFADGVDNDTGSIVAHASLSAAQAIPSTPFWTKVAFDAGVLNESGLFDSANRRMVAPISGRYWVAAQLIYEANTASIRAVMMRKNAGGMPTGGTQVGYDARNALAAGAWTTPVAVQVVVWLNAGETVEVFASQSSGATLNLMTGGTEAVTGFYAVRLP